MILVEMECYVDIAESKSVSWFFPDICSYNHILLVMEARFFTYKHPKRNNGMFGYESAGVKFYKEKSGLMI